jgi:hypothetical protein
MISNDYDLEDSANEFEDWRTCSCRPSRRRRRRPPRKMAPRPGDTYWYSPGPEVNVDKSKDVAICLLMALSCLGVPWLRDEQDSIPVWIISGAFAGVWVLIGWMSIPYRK